MNRIQLLKCSHYGTPAPKKCSGLSRIYLLTRIPGSPVSVAHAPRRRTFGRASTHARNSLIVVGRQDNLTVIEALLVRLDAPTPEDGSIPSGVNVSRLAKRVDQLERAVTRLTIGSNPGRSPRSTRERSSSVAPPSRQTGPAAEVTGTRLRIEARSAKGATFKVASIVPAGKRVKKGDLLLEIDSAEIREAVDVQQIQTEQAQSALIQSEAVAKNTQFQKETLVAEALLRIELAKLDLTEFEEGTRPLQLKVLHTEVEQARRKLEELKKRVDTGTSDARVLAEATAQLDVAETRLEVFEKFTVPKTIKDLQSAIATAKRDSERSRAQSETDVKAAQARVASRQAQAEFEASRLQGLKNDLKACKIVAPHDGVVAVAGPVSLGEGSQVRHGQVVLILIPDEKDE